MFKFFLAPMERYTDAAFRTMCYNYGADATFTEQTRIDALARNNKSAWRKLEITDATPTWIQLLGGKDTDLKKFLKLFEPQPGFVGFNLNLGCPSPHVIRNGFGCAMIKRITKTQKLVSSIKDAGYRCSMKLRLGMNQTEKDRKVYLNLINAVDAEFFVVHARHGRETYDDLADWSVYKECVRTKKPIIANGDICTQDHIDTLKEMGVQGAMIGRSAIDNPKLFRHLKR